MGGYIWKGVNKRICDKNGYILNAKSHKLGTQGCSESVIQIINYSKIKKHDHIVIFEDDIIPHKQFFRYWKDVNNFIDTHNNWKLIYLGISSILPKKYKKIIDKDNVTITRLPCDKAYSGGYGIIIHSSVFDDIIKNINDDKQKPHDIHAYGNIHREFKKECYVCLPNLVVADVGCSNIRNYKNKKYFANAMSWNLINHPLPKQILMFVVINNNRHRIQNFIDLVGMFLPVVKIIFLKHKNDNLNISKILTVAKNFANIVNINNSRDILHVVNKWVTKLKNNIKPYFIITNQTINWSRKLSKKLLSEIELNLCSNFDTIKFSIRKCSRCNKNNSIIHNLKFYQGFNIFNKRCLKNSTDDDIVIKNVKYFDLPFYSINSCNEISNNDFHTVTYYDFVDDIDRFKSNENLCESYISQLCVDQFKWINFLNNWQKSYLCNIITKNLNYPINFKVNGHCLMANIPNSDRKKFLNPAFRLKKLRYRFFRNKFEVIMGREELIKMFGIDKYNFIANMKKKFNIIDVELKIILNFIYK
jgi:hypothetical protein